MLINQLISVGAPIDVQVKCICIVFPRIVDLENLSGYLHTCSYDLRMEVYHRYVRLYAAM